MTLRGARFLVSGVVLGQPLGGVHRHNAQLLPRVAELLREQGASLTILEGETPIEFELPDFVERIACEVPAGPPLTRALAEGPAVRRALEQARRSGAPYTAFHSAHFPVPRGLAVPTTVTLHDLRRLARPNPISRVTARFTLKRALQAAKLVFCVTEAVQRELANELDIREQKIRVLENAGDHWHPAPRAAKPSGGLLSVGHMEPRKNLELLLRALARDPELPPLTLAGAPKDDEEERLRHLAGELALGDRVRFEVAVDDERLRELYANAECAVLPSRIEGFGIGVLEAQRSSVPLAISDIPAHREVAGQGVPHFEPDDVDQCVRGIRSALETSDAQLAVQRANAERYSWQRTAETWVAAWSELTDA